MALAWHPITPALVSAVTTLADSPWDRDALDAAWLRSGWPAPPGGSVIGRVIDDLKDPRLAVGDWDVDVRWSDDDEVTGFAVAFALFYESDDEDADDDPDLDEFPQHTPSDQWEVDKSADREQFDAVWQEALETLTEHLGEPEVVGEHGDEDEDDWHNAVWRAGSRLVVLAQGEDFSSYSLYDQAGLYVLDFPAESRIPRGDGLYELLVGDGEDED
ncbi:hypothetical protein Pth03_18460 [Planotetraspora thailandica]|uniref:Uncharacterized protein n=2 Tax=Planotetraspora thailandica TaxID=487172 RepID=A0A8J3V0V0_9ACTN|nr:hypothetical protein Pth03_18460 [Planotetraspora thailandica]